MAEALAAQEANRNAGLVVESHIQNGDDDDNINKGNGNRVTIMGMEIKMGEMVVQEEMNQSLRLVPTRIFSIANHTTLMVLKELSVWTNVIDFKKINEITFQTTFRGRAPISCAVVL
uniref:Uncharacterized protein n=1 Tax=Tanacetum cinerariifolium TaxID=118510 RepID=A0A6L2LBZ3_TANCI|nr:hypothetical protein [Tanacetum cinerariifolium]